jgi:DNA-binding transcriptional ArsR family regulator
LGDPTRLSLLIKLSAGEQRSIASLAAETSLSRQAVTKHLQVLENARLVSSVRIGRESRFAYRPEPVNDAISFLASISSQWDEALGRLKALVEED